MDYRFLLKFAGRTEAKLYSLKEKQKTIGKIGTSTTLIDLKTNLGALKTYYDGNKIEARDSFVSVRANNCVVKGKWCYEVLLESNGLFQLGFCQLITPFSKSNGVGDDVHSYGYDGFRLSCWNEKENRYGKVWDYGDIIGVCLDLDKKQIEFFQNGESLGIAKNNIEGGEGIAYFPGLSFSSHEKCAFNFGAFPFVYSYPGYEPIDIPKSQYNGSFEVTSSLLQILNQCKLFDVLDDDYTDMYFRNLINQKIFYFLINVSFKDFFLCKCLLFPFMYNLLKKNKGHYQIFMEQLMQNLKINDIDNTIFFSDFFEKLTNLIEEYGMMGPKYYKQYELYTTLFIEIINDEIYFREWDKTRNFFGHLRNIFTSNNFHFGSVYNKITEFYGEKQNEQTISVLLYKIVKDGNLVSQEMNEYDKKYIKINQIMIEKILNYYEKKTTLCQGTFIFYDLMRACYPINTIKDYIYNLNTFMNSENKKNIIAFKNVILSYMAYFFDKYKNINLKDIPIGSATILQFPHIKSQIINELSSTGIYVSYFREENIGGKSRQLLNVPLNNNSNVRFLSEEVFDGIHSKHAIKFNILVRLISLMDKFFFAYYELQSYVKDYIFDDYQAAGNGTTLVNAIFRFYFYLFNDYCQVVLYNISFFLIKWINNLVLHGQKLNILLLPLYLVDFPFQIAQMMLIFKSKILYDDEYRKELNKSCELFENDDFLESLIELYITLFEDPILSRYDALVESVGWKIFLFLREEKSRKLIIKKYFYIESIMKGISNIMNKNNAERIILRLLTILHRTKNESQFSKEEILEEEQNSQNVKKILQSEKYKTLFKSIISYFGKHLNTKLTLYCYDLDNCKQYCIDSGFKGKDINKYESAIKTSFKGICSVINFYEFALSIFSESFFQTNEFSLSLIYLRNFLINLTSRILDQPYFGYIETMLNHIHNENYSLSELVDSAVNFVVTCKRGSDKNLFIEFVVNTKEIFIHTLINIYSYGYDIIKKKVEKEKSVHYQIMQNKYEEYKELVYELKDKRNAFENENIKALQNMENIDDDLLCIICYKQIADHRFTPCNHKGCKECLLTYKADSTKCFMCRQPITSVQKIPNEEIGKGNASDKINSEDNENETKKESNSQSENDKE